ncbi:hypothetical protein Cgig2_017905 [Carnegiea gigantea]|uniref:Uncharacterized protein n=1 Tax=Carnegiea gigantea TaxID=171969 RepID=A0A9Q1K746_9CARY|nr:hypothetical protein Cgig2_017905 [Carnegiea gigantea]
MDIFDAEPNPTKCMGESDDVNFKEELAHLPLPSRSQYFPLIEQIPSFGKDLFDSRSRLDGGVFIFNVDAIIKEVGKNATRLFDQVILEKVSCTPFDGLHSLKGDFDSLYATILQRGVDVTPLENKVEGLIRHVYDLKVLQKCYSEVQGKLDASQRLNTVGIRYEAIVAELKQVAISAHLFRETEQELIDFQGQIDIINSTEDMDAATKANLEKTQAYIKESSEDFKNFQWDP